MGSPFRSFGNVELVNQPEKLPTREEMAAELAEDTCIRLKELKAAAMAAEQNADEPLPESPEQMECYKTLEALMKGPHGWVVKPVILEQFPELVRPPTDAEKQAVDDYLKSQVELNTP